MTVGKLYVIKLAVKDLCGSRLTVSRTLPLNQKITLLQKNVRDSLKMNFEFRFRDFLRPFIGMIQTTLVLMYRISSHLQKNRRDVKIVCTTSYYTKYAISWFPEAGWTTAIQSRTT